MKAWPIAVALCVALLLCAGASAAPTAVAVANAPEQWYTDAVAGNPTKWAPFEATTGYVPLPVFFTGWQSTPRADIVDYEWDHDLDDPGNPTYHGFCYAHVYDEVGTFTARLTVTDVNGFTHSDDVTITPLERPGPVYYVDSQTGSDSDTGLSEDLAWQTATKVWAMMDAKALAPGASVLFRRGQTFPLQSRAWFGHQRAGYGYLIGAHGTGDKPIIQRTTGGDTNDVKALIGSNGHDNWNHCVFQDLVFECKLTGGAVAGTLTRRLNEVTQLYEYVVTLPPGHGLVTGIKRDLYWDGGYRYQLTATVTGDEMIVLGGTGHLLPTTSTAVTVGPTRGDGLIQQGRMAALLVRRCAFNHAIQSLGINGFPTGNTIDRTFVVDCDFFEAANLHVFVKAVSTAVVGCSLDLSENHNFYGDWLKGAYVYGNTFERMPNGRTGLRISGESGSFENPTVNVVVRNNEITGGIDPIVDNGTHGGSGTRYTWVLSEIAPNAPNAQSIEWIDYSYNTLTNGESLLFLTACENVDIHDNTLSTVSPDTSSCRINVNPRMGKRPCKTVSIRDNAITTYCAGDANSNPRVFGVNAWAGDAYGEQTIHEGLSFTGNTITMTNRIGTGVWVSTDDAAVNAQITSLNTWVGVDRTDDRVVKLGGSWNVAGSQYTLDGWYLLSGNEAPEGEPTPQDPDPPADPLSKRVGILAAGFLKLRDRNDWPKEDKP